MPARAIRYTPRSFLPPICTLSHFVSRVLLKAEQGWGLRLGARCTIGRGAVVMYGADVGEDAHVMPHSVVMKQEHLLPGRRYAGAPTDEVS